MSTENYYCCWGASGEPVAEENWSPLDPLVTTTSHSQGATSAGKHLVMVDHWWREPMVVEQWWRSGKQLWNSGNQLVEISRENQWRPAAGTRYGSHS